MRRSPQPSRKIRPGDGQPLKPYRWWQALWRSMFSITLSDSDGTARRYTVDVDHFDWDIRLYTDAVQTAVGSYPVKFPVPGGVIHADLSLYGASRMHVEYGAGDAILLTPHPHSLEGLRAAFGSRFPRSSRALSWAAVLILATALALLVPQLLERVSHIVWVSQNVGTFTSPVNVPGWLNTTLIIAGVLAAFERALTIRNHWLIDADTWWLD